MSKMKKKLDALGLMETRMITVTDDWCPCYPDDKVKLNIIVRRKAGHKDAYVVVINAWGMDDTGVELVYEAGNNSDGAYDIYEHWKEYLYDRIPDGVDREWFFEHGFYSA